MPKWSDKHDDGRGVPKGKCGSMIFWQKNYKSTANNDKWHHFAASQRQRHIWKTSDQQPVVLLNSVYHFLSYVINERLKKIVEPANILEPRQGGGRQGRCVSINMQTVHFIQQEAWRQGKRVSLVDVDFKTPCLKQCSGRWWGCFKFQKLTYWSRHMKAPQSKPNKQWGKCDNNLQHRCGAR